MELSKTSQTRWECTAITHHPYTLCHFANCNYFVFVSCVHRRVLEGSGVGVEYMLMCIESELCCGWLQCSCYTEHGRYGLSCMLRLWSPWAVYGMLECQLYVVNFCWCWTWHTRIVFYVEGCGVRSADYGKKERCGRVSWEEDTWCVQDSIP